MSMIHIGSAYKRGTGIPTDLDAAEMWFRRAADAGLLYAHYALGRLYFDQKRHDDAREAFEFGVARKHVAALHFLGRMYISGKGVPKDIEKGLQLLKRASDGGNIFAKAALGHFFIRGDLVPRQLLRGLRLLLEANISFIKVALTEGPTSERFR